MGIFLVEWWIEKITWVMMEHKMDKEIIKLNIDVELVREDEYFILATTDKSKELLGEFICVQGKSQQEVETEFWEMLKFINDYNKERSDELNKWKPFQKGDWSHIGGTWFTIYGFHMYFRKGKGMIGGWYVPFTDLNISVHNFWRKRNIK